MAKGLTVKQKKFVKAYVANDGNQTEAAMQVYNVKDRDVARKLGSENMTKPDVKAAIELALEKHDITIDAAVKPIADGLVADKPSFVDKDGNEHGGGVDHSTRLKASSMALKLLGAEQNKEQSGNTFIFSNNSTFNSGKYKK